MTNISTTDDQVNETLAKQQKWVGKTVKYTDEYRNEHDAIITQCWSLKEDDTPAYINVVYVSGDPKKTDQYGRQTEHSTSVFRKTEETKAGRNFDLI